MERKQKVGNENSATRSLLLDAAERILRVEGYAAVTSRRVSAQAGVSSKLVHYYFPTMDELFLALYRRISQQFLDQTTELLRTGNPLRILWQNSVNPDDIDLFTELMALGNHRKVIKAELRKGLVRLREIQLAALDLYFARRGVKPPIETTALLVILVGAGFHMDMEARNDFDLGHAETIALFERLSAFGPTGSSHG